MIGQSMIYVRSDGRTRIAGVAAALFLLSFILYASPLVEQIPLAALVGVIFIIVIATFAWNTFRIMRVAPRFATSGALLVAVGTVLEDLAVAVVVGVASMRYAWKNAVRISAKNDPDYEVGLTTMSESACLRALTYKYYVRSGLIKLEVLA